MKKSHEKTLILAVCEDESIHSFSTFSESTIDFNYYGINHVKL